MFDLSRLGETISGLVNAAQPAQAASLEDVMQNVGLDPSVLTGLSETEIGSLLASYGIDISQFSNVEISQFVEGLGIPGVSELVSSPWGDGTHES